jgi:hypothetical protein
MKVLSQRAVQRRLWLARHIPRWLRYWVVIVAAAEATTGPYSDTEVPALTLDLFLKRIEA